MKERFMWAHRWGNEDLPEEVRTELGLKEWIEFKIRKRGFKVQERGGQEKSVSKHATKKDRVSELFLWIIRQHLFSLFFFFK